MISVFHTTADITLNITFCLYNEILNNIAYKGNLEVGKENSNDVQNFRHVKMRKKKKKTFLKACAAVFSLTLFCFSYILFSTYHSCWSIYYVCMDYTGMKYGSHWLFLSFVLNVCSTVILTCNSFSFSFNKYNILKVPAAMHSLTLKYPMILIFP